jgi:hypothetical protein
VKHNKLQQTITDDDFLEEFTALPQTFSTTTNKYFYAPREQENFDQYQAEVIFTPTTRRNGKTRKYNRATLNKIVKITYSYGDSHQQLNQLFPNKSILEQKMFAGYRNLSKKYY